ncbi:MAG TPA: peptide-methionine (R)-S-oxide reductase MsrB [Candidatus Paceibacterota bacterium]
MMTEQELREYVMKKKGTEKPFTGKFWDNHEKGMYVCADCGAQLFSSDTKFDSGTGWPSFDQALPGAVGLEPDNSLFRKRTEVLCAKCGGHLGHVFNDGPKDPSIASGQATGQRFCINSCALDLDTKGE